MKRLGAFALAALMVAAALYARGAMDGDEEAVVEGGGVEQAGIVCAGDLAEVCSASGVALVATPAAGTTADALVTADDPADLGGAAWLVTEAWASLVVDERTRNREEPLFEVVGGPLASSEVVVAVWADRAAQLAERCGEPLEAAPGWRCLAEQSGSALQAGDRVRVAGPDVDSAAGLVVAASQAAGLLGATDFASNDFDQGDFRSLATALAGGQTAEPLRSMRSQGPGQVTAAGTIAARATNLSSTFGTIRPGTLQPAARADVVLVVPVGTDVSGDVRAALAGALLEAGWDRPADGPSGLPSGGVLAAIRTLWSQDR